MLGKVKETIGGVVESITEKLPTSMKLNEGKIEAVCKEYDTKVEKVKAESTAKIANLTKEIKDLQAEHVGDESRKQELIKQKEEEIHRIDRDSVHQMEELKKHRDEDLAKIARDDEEEIKRLQREKDEEVQKLERENEERLNKMKRDLENEIEKSKRDNQDAIHKLMREKDSEIERFSSEFQKIKEKYKVPI